MTVLGCGRGICNGQCEKTNACPGINVGDTLKLKGSYGPAMTVEGSIGCLIFLVWFDTRHQLQKAKLYAEMLESV